MNSRMANARVFNGPYADEYSMNEKIRYLENMRGQIHAMANKYNLENNVKVATLSLLTVLPHKNGHHHMNNGDPSTFIYS